MIVGEVRPARHTETASAAFVFDELPTVEVTLPDGEIVDPAPTVSDVSEDPGFGVENLTHILSAPVSWSQGGAYTLRWSMVQDGQAPIIRIETYFAAWTDVYTLIRRLLRRSVSQVPDEWIDAELAYLTTSVLADWTCIGETYNAIVAADRGSFDRAMAYMVAAQLKATLREGIDGQIVERQEGDTRYKFAEAAKSGKIEDQWLNEAWGAFGRIGCVADVITATRSSLRIFSLSGRRRAAERAGYIIGTENPLLRYLIDEDRRLLGTGIYG
jgi:hypothetical protein